MHWLQPLYLVCFAELGVAKALPPPTGTYNVARTQHVIQHKTPNDPLAPPGKARSFLINVWYPTQQALGDAHPAAYDGPLATIYEDYFSDAYNISADGFLKNLTAQVQHGRAAPLPGHLDLIRNPTLIFQPPFVGPPSQCFTSLLTDLASKGYTIVTLDHPYEQPFIQYPDGGPGFYGPDVTYIGNITVWQRYNAIRMADARAFLNAWPAIIAQIHAQDVFNATHFVAMGHSIGGSASIGEILDLQARKHQFIGGIDLDGNLFGKAGNENSGVLDTKLPTLFMASDRDVDEGWTSFGARQSAWWRYFQVDGTVHTDYSDLVLWKQWLGITTPGPEKIEAMRMVDLVRTWVGGFVEKVVTGSRSTVVEGPSDRWSEVNLIGARN